MIRPTLNEAKTLAENNTIIPIALEIFSDMKTPIEVLRNIKRQSDDWFILESVNGADRWGRYSFLGYKPVREVFGIGDAITIVDKSSKTDLEPNAVSVIRAMISKYKSPRISELPPFTGGFVGYFAYDFVRHFIPDFKSIAKNDNGFRDFHLMLIDKVIAFDHFKQKIFLIVNVPAADIETGYIKGITELKDMEKMILDTEPHPKDAPSVCGEFSPLYSETDFIEMVDTVKSHIVDGDILQAVISNRHEAPFKGSLMNTYRMLRTINPSPYMVHMRIGDIELACASPETLVALRDGEISSFPLAGTCPRGQTDAEDKALINALLHDEKELGEHDMLVDLAKNDIGKVSASGSVRVSEYRQIKRFSHVSHISSCVQGNLRKGVDALDVIAATFPAGTLSGAPKKRTCEIIDAVEDVKRGVYGGAIGYIDFTGNMDMCIGIRMAVLKDEKVYVQAGAGIVADSVPEKEYQETRYKASAVMEALKQSGEI